MSRLTREDALVSKLMPAVRATRPESSFRRAAAVNKALTPDGFVYPDAILPGSSTVVVDFDASSATASSSDTVNYTAYLGTTIHLPSGTWRLKVRGALSGRLSGSSNMNSQILLNGNASSNFQIPLAAADMGTVFPRHSLDEVSGDVLLQLMFRPSAGTLTIEAGEWLYRAERIS